ncbi:cyclase family protein [Thalassotalea mangrovi]|uniref:Cyclase family protein n=2 Tax=Thalassotalea mangrovi TaxID=2572245 RepID=A0A4U1B645_9GAMM|nr:cyclase family protein [Thalassotalea mangrovi]
MRGASLLLIVLSLVALVLNKVLADEAKQAGQWIDLSHEFSDETLYWPTAEKFSRDIVFHGINDKGFFYSANNYFAAEHGGTHLDAPIHFAQGKQSVEQIPLEQLIGDAVVISIKEQVEKDRDYQLQVKDIKKFEQQYGEIAEHTIVLINTGMANFWPDAEKYLGTGKRGDEGVNALSFPGIHPDAAKFLTHERKIKAVGLDTASLDYGKSKQFKTHRIFSAQNIPGMENLNNLDQLPATGVLIIALPMKIKGGSGGPLRAVAMVKD